MKYLSFLFTISILLTFQISYAQLTPVEAIAGMGRGINLGNTLEPPREGEWNNGPVEEIYFDAYVNAGFTNVRIPVRWDLHTQNSAPFTIDPSWMDRVEQVVDWGLSRGLFVTLNGHHEDWLKNNYSNATFRARYDSIWVQIADRFKNKSDSLLFEMINEPKGMTVAQVDDLNERILGIIRASNPTRIVIYGGNMYSNSAELLNAAIPDDEFIVGYYHAYDPWEFSGLGNGTWGTPNDYQALVNKYQSVKNWSIANDIPIHHSEFGAIHRCDFNSRMRIYAHNVEQCVINSFAFSVWDDGGDFGILKRNTNTWPEVKDILVHYHPDSPNQITSTLNIDPLDTPSIIITWNNRTTENTNIIVERSIGATSNFEQIATLPSDATTFTDVNVSAGNTYTYRMHTQRPDGTLLHGYPTRIRIINTVQSPFNGGMGIAIPGQLEVEEYDLGGEGLAYHDSDPANIPNAFRSDEGVDIGAFGNGYILEYVANGEWIEYTVNVAETGTYKVSAITASEVSNGAFSITSNQNNASVRFTTPNTGSWTTFQPINANALMELEAGPQQFRLEIENNNPFNLNKLIFSLESTTSVNEISVAYMKVFPNPTYGHLNVELSDEVASQNYLLEIFTATGKKIRTLNLIGNAHPIKLNFLKNGLYIIKVHNEMYNLIHRVIKL